MLRTQREPEPAARPRGRRRGYRQKRGWSQAERHILILLSHDFTPAEIARIRHRSYSTVKTQIERMREYAAVRTTRQLVEAFKKDARGRK